MNIVVLWVTEPRTEVKFSKTYAVSEETNLPIVLLKTQEHNRFAAVIIFTNTLEDFVNPQRVCEPQVGNHCSRLIFHMYTI